jgi:hypothetical protein
MLIKEGTLVVFTMYDAGEKKPPETALGIVVGEIPKGRPDEDDSFNVKILCPEFFEGRQIGVLQKDLFPLAQNCYSKGSGGSIYLNLPEIVLSLVKKIDALKKEVAFLQQANQSL